MWKLAPQGTVRNMNRMNRKLIMELHRRVRRGCNSVHLWSLIIQMQSIPIMSWIQYKLMKLKIKDPWKWMKMTKTKICRSRSVSWTSYRPINHHPILKPGVEATHLDIQYWKTLIIPLYYSQMRKRPFLIENHPKNRTTNSSRMLNSSTVKIFTISYKGRSRPKIT